MNAIRYFSCRPSNYGLPNKPILEVHDYDADHLTLFTSQGEAVVLDAVQVDKLRQQFHEWLHERALRADESRRWETIRFPKPRKRRRGLQP